MVSTKEYPIKGMKGEKLRDFIMDLYNEGGYEVYTKNVGDEDEYFEWLSISMGIVACFILNQIVIKKYRKIKNDYV